MKSTINTSLQNSIYSPNNNIKVNTVKVLLVGNNPLELAMCSEQLVHFKKRKFNIDIAFNNEECYRSASKYHPSAIILDDSIGFMNLMEITDKFHKDSRFHNIPIVVIKNSNYYHAGITGNVIEFILKDSLDQVSLPEIILTAVINQKVKEKDSEENLPASLDKKMSKLFLSLFSLKKG